jgi:apolipoprotein D and lipocalin family protein
VPQTQPTQRSKPLVRLLVSLAALALPVPNASAAENQPEAPPLQSLPTLDVPAYMGTWYQVALFPNRFQRQCVSNTTATYLQRADGAVAVTNRCRLADGSWDEAAGLARPQGVIEGRQMTPARLEVSFLPAVLRWLPIGWGRYWVIQLADDGRYAVVSEPTREYLWVLSRQPVLAAGDESAIRSKLVTQGFADLGRLELHRQAPPAR